jgi:hypothetical protein
LTAPLVGHQTETQISSIDKLHAYIQSLVEILGFLISAMTGMKANVPAKDTKIVAEAVILAMKVG